jgi:hypothetical protein
MLLRITTKLYLVTDSLIVYIAPAVAIIFIAAIRLSVNRLRRIVYRRWNILAFIVWLWLYIYPRLQCLV